MEAYRRPEVPYAAGPAAAEHGATSMIDVSDGLLQDLGHIAAASVVGIDIDRAAFEVPAQMRDAASALGVDPYLWLLAGGDDHALAATFQAQDAWPTAGKLYVHFLALDATNPDGYLRLGECFLAAREIEEARTCFENARRLAADGHGRPGVLAHAICMLDAARSQGAEAA